MGGGLGRSDYESRAAYLSGLVKGLDLAAGSEEGRVLARVVELLEELAREVTRLRAELLAGAARPEPRPAGTARADAGCDGAARVTGAPARTADGPERPLFVACECPECGEEMFVQAHPLPGGTQGEGSPEGPHEVVCPNCGNLLFLSEPPAAEAPPGRRRPRRPRRRDQRTH